METENCEPVLARPGAGLPIPELFVARLLFFWKRRSGTRQAFSDEYEANRQAISRLVSSVPEDQRGTRVLIPRLRGLEDSSRHWSVWMTLDHLRITNRAFTGVIATLSEGKVPPGRADTAAVKPAPESGPETEEAFEISCDDLISQVNSVSNLETALRFPHPWFGPLNAAGWQALSAMHLGIHRKQIAEIARRLHAS
ncbi:MAG: DinB family protein [Verrucomicrobiae bacterium]|nr:DinB family protein [Verrucomicrobiae bacterium]